MVRLTKILCAGVALGAMSVPAQADVVSLNFEGVNATYPSGFAQILEFYNGGTSSAGTSGTNYGVSFGSNALALCLNTPGVSCSNTSRGGVGDPNSQRGGLVFLEGNETYLNFAAGFDTGFSFNYSAPNTTGSVMVYDGLNGTGNLLATVNLGLTPSNCGGEYGAVYCPFVAAGVTFSGTARSIAFGGVANYIVFDDVTFGSATPGPGNGVPEPAEWALMLTGFGLAGAGLRSHRKRERMALA